MSGDYQLLCLAESRMTGNWKERAIPAAEVYKELGITQEDIDAAEDLEIETPKTKG